MSKIIFTLVLCIACVVTGKENNEEFGHNGNNEYSAEIVKKKNIPVTPVETTPEGNTEKLYEPLKFYNGEHPVIHKFVSDRNRYLFKKTHVPLQDDVADVVKAFSNPNLQQQSVLDERIDSDRREENFNSKRFNLYPKWYSSRIPSIFGKRFAKSYFYPYPLRRRSINRDRISQKVPRSSNSLDDGITDDSRPHELPLSWLEPHHRQTISTRSLQSLQSSRFDDPTRALLNSITRAGLNNVLPQLGNAKPELVDIPDEMLFHRRGYRAVPYELMDRMDSTMYEPLTGAPNAQWTQYDDLPEGHYHRHYMNPCHHNPCRNHGKCHFTHRHHRMYDFKCYCNKGFSGHYCEVSPYSCHPTPCQNGGTCTKTKSLVFCSCLPDFKGHHCEDERICITNPCMNDGTCTETSNGFHCQCQSGFSGKTCEENINVCDNNPCKNGGTCHDMEGEGQFECTCPNGFGCVDCSCPIELGATQEHVKLQGDVTVTQNSVTEHEGIHGCPLNTCHNGGTCIKGSSGFLCNCPVGYHGLNCEIPDLCNPNPCQNNGVCLQDGEENYKCICPYGFKGTDCQLALSCSGHPCGNGATCVETSDAYHCKCPVGYKGLKCTDISPCSHNPCLHKSSCFEKGTMYTCQCKSGYQGKTCNEHNPCFPNPCSNGQCLERYGTTICKCNQGWMGDKCDVEDLCHQGNHCANGGTCVHHYFEFKCLCPAGFRGETCEVRLPCFDNPCENGGICEDAADTYVCKCSNGFHGERCHLKSHCYPNPCENDGRCFESADNFACECPHNYLGKICEEPKFCVSNPCLNGGHCIEVDDVFHCQCPLGFFGRTCVENVCDHNPCRNGGTCMPANNHMGFACECVFPYHGHQCDEMDACMPNPCRHGGTCHSHLQHIQEMSYHEGPQFHGSDENVVSIVGPIYNETIHHAPYYDSHEHSLKLVPDESLLSNEVHHFHLTGDSPDHVYDEQLYHSKFEDHPGELAFTHHGPYHHNHHGDYDDFTHDELFPNHKLLDDLHVDKKSSIENKTTAVHSKKKKRNRLALKRAKIQLRKKAKIEIVPKVMINIKNKKSTIVKRTIHDLYVCQCAIGFLGAHCQHINPCDSNPCHNNGICVPRGELYQCQCVNGFGGFNCQDPHPCEPNPCLHDGKCALARNVHGYLCACVHDWRGINCEMRDMCAIHNPCLHGGVCINQGEEKVKCKCRARFAGDTCEVDKCASCDINSYCHHGTCVCKPDFVGNGFKCKALGNICEPNPCANGGTCRIGVDGHIFTCECIHGFVGARCELPNPCVSSPCLHNGACIDESNSKEKGILMTDHNDYKCFCTPGYRGTNCEETNLAACSSGPCQNNGYCFDASSESHRRHLVHPDAYECFCPPGFSGKNCEFEHYPCVSSPCMNGGHCLDAQKLPGVSFDAHGYKCHCPKIYAGRNCEVTVSGYGACHTAPCLHDGRCVDIMNNNDPDLHFDYDHEFKCFCSASFSGKFCEVPYPACHSAPCQHNGVCVDKTNDADILFDDTGYECKCTAGYEGKNCERQYAMNVMDDSAYDHNTVDATLLGNHHIEPVNNYAHTGENEIIEEQIGPEHITDEGDTIHGPGVTHLNEHSAEPHNVHYTGEPTHVTGHDQGHHQGVNINPNPTPLGDAFIHTPSEMDHLVLPHSHLTTPQPVLSDTVAHHPVNPSITREKFDFPLRNPSPTTPILLNKDIGITHQETARAFTNAYLDYKKQHPEKRAPRNHDVGPATHVIYLSHGRRSGIAK